MWENVPRCYSYYIATVHGGRGGRRGREQERGARRRRTAHGGGRPLAQYGHGRRVGVCMLFVRRPVGGGLPARVVDVKGGGVGKEVGGEIDEDKGEGRNT